jgi:hypothetical protein
MYNNSGRTGPKKKKKAGQSRTWERRHSPLWTNMKEERPCSGSMQRTGSVMWICHGCTKIFEGKFMEKIVYSHLKLKFTNTPYSKSRNFSCFEGPTNAP